VSKDISSGAGLEPEPDGPVLLRKILPDLRPCSKKPRAERIWKLAGANCGSNGRPEIAQNRSMTTLALSYYLPARQRAPKVLCVFGTTHADSSAHHPPDFVPLTPIISKENRHRGEKRKRRPRTAFARDHEPPRRKNYEATRMKKGACAHARYRKVTIYEVHCIHASMCA
jgi:hypothetical protein